MASKTTYKVIFRVKKAYYEQIVAGTKTTEFRADSPYWHKALISLNKFFERVFGWKDWLHTQTIAPWTAEVKGVQAVFICAKGQKHVREVKAIGQQATPADVREIVGTPRCFTFYLGAEIKTEAAQNADV